MSKFIKADECVGKRILAGEPIFQFSTGKMIGWTRRRCIGIIEKIENSRVYVFNSKNPEGYQRYELSADDFKQWLLDKSYVLK